MVFIPTKKNKNPIPRPIRLNACVFASSSIIGSEPLTDIEKPRANPDNPINDKPIQIGNCPWCPTFLYPLIIKKMKNAPTANAGTTSLFNSMLKNLGIKNNNATNGIMKDNASLITDDLDFKIQVPILLHLMPIILRLW